MRGIGCNWRLCACLHVATHPELLDMSGIAKQLTEENNQSLAEMGDRGWQEL